MQELTKEPHHTTSLSHCEAINDDCQLVKLGYYTPYIHTYTEYIQSTIPMILSLDLEIHCAVELFVSFITDKTPGLDNCAQYSHVCLLTVTCLSVKRE